MCHCVLLHHLRSALFLFLLLLCHRIVIVFGLSIFAFIFLLFIFLNCISQSCCICIKKNSHATKSWTFVIRSLSTRFAVSVVFFFHFHVILTRHCCHYLYSCRESSLPRDLWLLLQNHLHLRGHLAVPQNLPLQCPDLHQVWTLYSWQALDCIF